MRFTCKLFLLFMIVFSFCGTCFFSDFALAKDKKTTDEKKAVLPPVDDKRVLPAIKETGAHDLSLEITSPVSTNISGIQVVPVLVDSGLGLPLTYTVRNNKSEAVNLLALKIPHIRELYIDNLGCTSGPYWSQPAAEAVFTLGAGQLATCKALLTPGSVFHPGNLPPPVNPSPYGAPTKIQEIPLPKYDPNNQIGRYTNFSLKQVFNDRGHAAFSTSNLDFHVVVPRVGPAAQFFSIRQDITDVYGSSSYALTQNNQWQPQTGLQIYTLDAFPDYVQIPSGKTATLKGRFLIRAERSNRGPVKLDQLAYCHLGRVVPGNGTYVTPQRESSCDKAFVADMQYEMGKNGEKVEGLPYCKGQTLMPGEACVEDLAVTLKANEGQDGLGSQMRVISLGILDQYFYEVPVARVTIVPAYKEIKKDEKSSEKEDSKKDKDSGSKKEDDTGQLIKTEISGLPEEMTVQQTNSEDVTVTLSLGKNAPFVRTYPITKISMAKRDGNFVITDDADCLGKALIKEGTAPNAGEVYTCKVKISFKTNIQVNDHMIHDTEKGHKVHYKNALVVFQAQSRDPKATPVENNNIIAVTKDFEIKAKNADGDSSGGAPEKKKSSGGNSDGDSGDSPSKDPKGKK